MDSILVSVVICTYNRGKYLERCIKSLKSQSYSNFEIIVVNGPSIDETDTILKKYPDIKIIFQRELNGLSIARNLGVEACAGEIIAFIDDDAMADKNWIRYLVDGYTDEYIGGVGGPVLDITGKNYQFKNGFISRYGIPSFYNDHDLNYNQPDAKFFNYIMGTNSSFKKSVLYKVGLFDSDIKYYLDETDLCVRIIKSGYTIKHVENAIVFHEMAEGYNRTSTYDLNWREIIKNVIYFILKNFPGELESYTIRPIGALFCWSKYFICLSLKREISINQLIIIYFKLIKGAIDGYKDGVVANSIRSNSLYDFDSNNKHIKICLLSQEFSNNCNGGVCRYTYDLANGLAKMGNEVHVISRSEKDYGYEYKDGNVFVHRIVSASMESLPIGLTISKKNLSYSYSAWSKLRELKKRFGIQIVEAPLWDAEGFVLSLVKNILFVVRIETPLFKVAEIQGWQHTTDQKIANWMEGETARRADKVITISKAIGALISENHRIAQERMELCPLGIEIPDENSLLINRKTDILSILFVGRLEKRKGIDTLFKAIPLIVDKVPNARFIIVGKDTNLSMGGGSYKDYLLDNLDKNYHNKVTLTGYVDNNELSEFYRQCDIFVAPSLYESFGLIYLEAMAWGKPVIGCRIGGIPEVIEDGVTGILVPPEDEVSLANAIIRIVKEDLIEDFGRNGRKRVENNFTINKMVKNTCKIYKDVITHSD